ncbi:MAG: hypothetical protein JO202_06495 [Ktedonobacteraceae bacterium]|nr:hypothetical protein [Ktedonobacteraceae bacterium]
MMRSTKTRVPSVIGRPLLIAASCTIPGKLSQTSINFEETWKIGVNYGNRRFVAWQCRSPSRVL